ncbi:MAG: hypothetical protein ACREQK_11410, partial [Candidatus Binatia bacterium]
LPDRLHGVREGRWDRGDGTLTDYLLEKDQGLGVAKSALPIFMLGSQASRLDFGFYGSSLGQRRNVWRP